MAPGPFPQPLPARPPADPSRAEGGGSPELLPQGHARILQVGSQVQLGPVSARLPPGIRPRVVPHLSPGVPGTRLPAAGPGCCWPRVPYRQQLMAGWAWWSGPEERIHHFCYNVTENGATNTGSRPRPRDAPPPGRPSSLPRPLGRAGTAAQPPRAARPLGLPRGCYGRQLQVWLWANPQARE